MAQIRQNYLFSWEEIDDYCPDLDRFRMVRDAMPDEALVRALRRKRGKGRNRYPVEAMWNTMIAGVVFGHPSIESLRRELMRNPSLRWACGFTGQGVPSPAAFTRFLHNLIECQEWIDQMFDDLVDRIRDLLPDFGRRLAIDSKAIESRARRRPSKTQEDGRRDLDADWGRKTYAGVDASGKAWTKIVTWFGYKLHLIVDADTELPVAWRVTEASASDITVGREMIEELAETREDIVETCEELTADKGYDDTKLIRSLWDDHDIRPVIDIRNMWKDRQYRKLSRWETVEYDYRGAVYCVCPVTRERRRMRFQGFEWKRQTLKYRCPACDGKTACKGAAQCPVNRTIRIRLSENRRVFTPLARSTPQWKRAYKRRTSVERTNSRMDVSFGFEDHFLRGRKKVTFRCGFALAIQLALAVARIRAGQKEHMRSLVHPAA